MVVIDEYTRQCLAIHVTRRIRAEDAFDVFAELMQTHDIAEHIRSDNGPVSSSGVNPFSILPGNYAALMKP